MTTAPTDPTILDRLDRLVADLTTKAAHTERRLGTLRRTLATLANVRAALVAEGADVDLADDVAPVPSVDPTPTTVAPTGTTPKAPVPTAPVSTEPNPLPSSDATAKEALFYTLVASGRWVTASTLVDLVCQRWPHIRTKAVHRDLNRFTTGAKPVIERSGIPRHYEYRLLQRPDLGMFDFADEEGGDGPIP